MNPDTRALIILFELPAKERTLLLRLLGSRLRLFFDREKVCAHSRHAIHVEEFPDAEQGHTLFSSQDFINLLDTFINVRRVPASW